MKSSDLYGENVAFNASISDGLQTFNTDLVQPNESDDPWTNLKLYLIFNCPSVAGFHDVAADQVYLKKSTSHGVKTDMTPAYAAAMDPGGKFIMVTPSKIAMILLIVKTEEFRENDESRDGNLFDANILKKSTARRVIHNSYTVRKHPIQSPVCLIEEKFGYIIQVPDAPLKVSEKLPLSNSDAVHDWEKMFFNVDNEDPDPVAAITDIVLL